MEFSDFFQFHKFLAPLLIKVMYWLGLSMIVILTLTALTALGRTDNSSVGGVLICLVVGAILLLFWRVWCEFLIVVFTMNDRLGIISGEISGRASLAAEPRHTPQ